MATSTQGSSLTFGGVTFEVVSVSVQSPTLEIVDITPADAALGTKWYAPTGDYTAAGRVSVEVLASFNPIGLQGMRESLQFNTPLGNFSYYVILESIEFTAQVGELFRATLDFSTTDYTA